MIVLLFCLCHKPLVCFLVMAIFSGFPFVSLAFFYFKLISRNHFKSELDCFSVLAGFNLAALVSDHLDGTTLHFWELFQ